MTKFEKLQKAKKKLKGLEGIAAPDSRRFMEAQSNVYQLEAETARGGMKSKNITDHGTFESQASSASGGMQASLAEPAAQTAFNVIHRGEEVEDAADAAKPLSDQAKISAGIAAAQGARSLAMDPATGDGGADIMGGALTGAATGAAAGTLMGSPGIGTAVGAGVGLVSGAIKSSAARREQDRQMENRKQMQLANVESKKAARVSRALAGLRASISGSLRNMAPQRFI